MSSQNKTQPTPVSPEEFIDDLIDDEQKQDSLTLLKLMAEVTGEKPVMWGSNIIGFKTYHYKYASGREGDFFKVGFSPRKGSLSLYLNGIMYELDEHQQLLARLGKHTHGKSCLYIKKLSDVDLDVLRELIKVTAESELPS
jgi:hypothetical protein